MTYRFEDWQAGAPLPRGWDVADAIEDGWTRDQLDAFIRTYVRPWNPPAVIEKPAGPVPQDDLAEIEPGDQPVTQGYGYPHCIMIGMTAEDFDRDPWRNHPLREWAFLTHDGIFYNINTAQKMSKMAFDVAMDRITPVVEVDGGEKGRDFKRYPASKTLVTYMHGLIATNYMYRPDVTNDERFRDARVIEHEGVSFVNSYRPDLVPVAAVDWEDHWAWQFIRDHFYKLVPDGARMIIQWLAHNVQFPGLKITWAPVIVGPQGAGKTVVKDIITAAMGRSNVSDASLEEVLSDYTDWGEGVCVRVLEELRIPGERRTTVMNRLKPYITNRTVRIYPKGFKGKEIQNVTNYLALTNFKDALAVDEGDRRWAIWHTGVKTRAEVIEQFPPEYFRRIYEAIDNHGDIIRAWLLSVDLSDFDRFNAPAMTEAKREMIEMARAPMDADLREALALGGEGVGPDVISTKHLSDAVKEIGGRALNTSVLANILTESGWAKLDRLIKWRGQPRRIYYRPDMVPAGVDGEDLIRHLRLRLDATGMDDNI